MAMLPVIGDSDSGGASEDCEEEEEEEKEESMMELERPGEEKKNRWEA